MRLDDMATLPHNWDSYGAAPISREVIDKAALVLAILERFGGHWDCVPMSSGGIQIEQHQYGYDIEVSIERATSNTKGGE